MSTPPPRSNSCGSPVPLETLFRSYELCGRRMAPEDRSELDVSSVVMTMNAAEPINPAVLEQFSTEFQPHGFQRAAFAPAYGLAESTLAVTEIGRAHV